MAFDGIITAPQAPAGYGVPRVSTVAEDIETMCLQRLEMLARVINENESSSAVLAMDRSQMISEVERLERVLVAVRTEPKGTEPKGTNPTWAGGLGGQSIPQRAEPPAGYGL